MRSFLQQPYPFGENVRRRLAFCAGIGLFVALFLAVFEPFGFDELSPGVKWQHAGLFGIVTFVISSFFQIILTRTFPRLFREETWKSWKEIVFLLITTASIGAGNYGLMLYLYPQNTSLTNFFRAELITLQVGIFPICFVVFMKQMTLYRRFAAEAKKVTDGIHAEEENVITAPPATPAQKIVLRGDNQKEELTLLANELFFISSADNYVRIQYEQSGTQKSVLMRSTLKKVEEQLADQSTFFRCHRMYLVNLKAVTAVSGNAQGLKLHLSGLEEPVPVSRSLTETIKEKLHHLSHSPQKA
jgi:hypothetical protein